MSRAQLKVWSVVAVAALVASCSDGAPPSAPRAAPAGLRVQPNALVVTSGNSADITVSKYGGAFWIGGAYMYFPANAICDPSAPGYSYGPASWDLPCATLQRSITIHVNVTSVDGSQVVEFSPALRFAPGNSVFRWVVLAYRVAPTTTKSNILWLPERGAEPVDEALTDSSVETWLQYGIAIRRIKHFSGYLVSQGRNGEEDTIWFPDDSTP